MIRISCDIHIKVVYTSLQIFDKENVNLKKYTLILTTLIFLFKIIIFTRIKSLKISESE